MPSISQRNRYLMGCGKHQATIDNILSISGTPDLSHPLVVVVEMCMQLVRDIDKGNVSEQIDAATILGYLARIRARSDATEFAKNRLIRLFDLIDTDTSNRRFNNLSEAPERLIDAVAQLVEILPKD